MLTQLSSIERMEEQCRVLMAEAGLKVQGLTTYTHAFELSLIVCCNSRASYRGSESRNVRPGIGRLKKGYPHNGGGGHQPIRNSGSLARAGYQRAQPASISWSWRYNFLSRLDTYILVLII